MKRKPKDLDHYKNYVTARAYSYYIKKQKAKFKRFVEFCVQKGWYIIDITKDIKGLPIDKRLLIVKTDEDYFKEYYETYQYLNPGKYYYVYYKEVYSKQVHKRTITKHKATIIKNRDGNKCLICGDTHNLTLDHIYPFSKTKDTSFYNLATLCSNCNRDKGDTDFVNDLLLEKVVMNVRDKISIAPKVKVKKESKVKEYLNTKRTFIDNLCFILFS